MSRRTDWNRKHSLILVFLLLFIIALYVLGYQRVIAPLADDASLVVAPNTGALSAAQLPSEPVSDIWGFIAPVAERSGVTFNSGEPLAQDIETSIPGVVGMSYTVQVTAGDAQSLHSFVYSLTRTAGHVQVDNVRLSEPEGKRQLDLIITMYHKP